MNLYKCIHGKINEFSTFFKIHNTKFVHFAKFHVKSMRTLLFLLCILYSCIFVMIVIQYIHTEYSKSYLLCEMFCVVPIEFQNYQL